jgi:hypothetical protein
MTAINTMPTTGRLAPATGGVGRSVHIHRLVRKCGMVHAVDGRPGIVPGESLALLGPSGGLQTPRRGGSDGDVTLKMEIR